MLRPSATKRQENDEIRYIKLVRPCLCQFGGLKPWFEGSCELSREDMVKSGTCCIILSEVVKLVKGRTSGSLEEAWAEDLGIRVQAQGLGPVIPMRGCQSDIQPGCDLRTLLEAPVGLAGIPCISLQSLCAYLVCKGLPGTTLAGQNLKFSHRAVGCLASFFNLQA